MRRNKFYSLLLSFVIAFALWMFVVSNVSLEDSRTFYNIPVVLEGESVLADRNLMITKASVNTVSLRLRGSRSDLNKIGSSGMTVKADVSKVTEPGERIALAFTPVYPGDVSSGSVAVEERKPASVFIDVDYKRTKELPVQIKWTGTRAENYLYDAENAVLDNTVVTISGPAAVVDTIEYAAIEVDLTGRVESISESYRYTLCDSEGNPVDAQDITTNVEQIRVDMPIRRIRELQLAVNVNYGGGANEGNTTIQVEPQVIRVSASDAVLETLGDTFTLATIQLAELEKTSNDLVFPITLPEGVTNQTGVNEAKVTVSFTGLMTKTFKVDTFVPINIPEGLDAEIINTALEVRLRGPVNIISTFDPALLAVEVDFANAEAGTSTYKARVVIPEEYTQLGALGSYTVTAVLQAARP